MDSTEVKKVEAYVDKLLSENAHLEEHMTKVKGLNQHFEKMIKKKKGYIKPTRYQEFLACSLFH